MVYVRKGWSRHESISAVKKPLLAGFFQRLFEKSIGKYFNCSLSSFPGRKWHIFSTYALLIIFSGFLFFWISTHTKALFDATWHNDDVQQHLFAFHRYGPEKALKNDPLAEEFLSLSPPAFHALYAILVPVAGLMTSPKLMQALCYAIIFGLALFLMKSKRGGLAVAILFAFGMLHSPMVTEKMMGGLAENFAFPSLSCWAVGALTGSQRLRYGGAILASLFYPPMLVILLLSELFMLFIDHRNDLQGTLRKQLKSYVYLVVACILLVGFYRYNMRSHVESFPVLKKARENPIFYDVGRTRKLPFPDSIRFIPGHFASFFSISALHKIQYTSQLHAHVSYLPGAIFTAIFLCLILLRVSPKPWIAISLFNATLACYFLARIFAFQLYLPRRYIEFGAPASMIWLTATIVGLAWPKIKNSSLRTTMRNLAVGIFIIVYCLVVGFDPKNNRGMTIYEDTGTRIYQKIRTLPVDTLISGHPIDLDGIPFFTGRAVLDNYETILPWANRNWKKKVARVRNTLFSLYTTRKADLISFCDRYGVTHLLINRLRYRRDFKEKMLLFEPFDSELRRQMTGVSWEQLTLRLIPDGAIIARQKSLELVQVNRLRKEWERQSTRETFPPGPD